MEYPFGHDYRKARGFDFKVLILLLVEYPFGRLARFLRNLGFPQVLILLLVEYPFGLKENLMEVKTENLS